MTSELPPEPTVAPFPLLVIAGPTASGKTALAIALARALDAEILSADSRQVYRRCDIVTAKPTRDEQALARHHLIDIAAPEEMFSAAQWADSARQVLVDIGARGKRAIVCGGTGFYIRALLEPERIAAPVADETLRAQLEEECDSLGLEAMHARLQVLAPERANMTHQNDRYRIVRALGIALSNADAPPASTCSTPALPQIPHIAFRLSWARAELYERIESRVDLMQESGAWDELRDLLGSGVSREAPALSGVGYRQMIPVLDGAMSREDGVALWKQESRRYAKRQETWFSNQLGAQALNASVGADAMAEEVLQVLGHYLEAAATNSGGPSAGG